MGYGVIMTPVEHIPGGKASGSIGIRHPLYPVSLSLSSRRLAWNELGWDTTGLPEGSTPLIGISIAMSCGCPAFIGSSMPGRGGPACIDIGEEAVPSDTAVTEPRCSGVSGGEDDEGAYCDADCGDMGTA